MDNSTHSPTKGTVPDIQKIVAEIRPLAIWANSSASLLKFSVDFSETEGAISAERFRIIAETLTNVAARLDELADEIDPAGRKPRPENHAGELLEALKSLLDRFDALATLSGSKVWPEQERALQVIKTVEGE